MKLILKEGSVAVEGPKGFEVVTSEITMHGLKYDDFAVIEVTESKDSALFEIADKLPSDLVIILKKKKKFLGMF